MNSAALINQAMALHQQGRLAEAEVVYEKVLGLDSNNFDALQLLGLVNAQRGSFHEAEKLLRKALSIDATVAPCFHNYGTVLCMLKRFDEGIESYASAIKLAPNHAPLYSDRGNARYELKRYDEALADYDKALALNPGLADSWLGRGNIFFARKRNDDAFAAFDNALRLNPNLANAWLGRGNVFFELKRYAEALAAYDKALSLNPGVAGAWLGRGNVFYKLTRYDEALVAYDKALALAPALFEVWLGRGDVFNKLKLHDKAAAAYAEVLNLAPQHPFTKGALLHQKMLACDWPGTDELISDIEMDIAAGKLSAEPFGWQGVAKSERSLQLCAELYNKHKYSAGSANVSRAPHLPHAKIRIGYSSGEFREQATSTLIAGVLELHDKSRFEIYGIDNGWDDQSEMRRRIEGSLHGLIDIRKINDQSAAAAIRDNQIDILVNLNGYFGEERTQVFAEQPAPIQVNYLGFPGTVGAPYIDYIIADRHVIPPHHREFFTEKVVYLPECYQANDGKRSIGTNLSSRHECGLPQNGFVFCCFNNNYKIVPDVFDCWMRILDQVEGSVLWLLEDSHAAAANLRNEAAARGIAIERLVFAKRVPPADHLARHHLADLFLDTMPYNAHTTASDALWAGLPVLTLMGETFAGRVAGSLLNAIRLPELITTTLDSYEKMAIDLARHPDRLAAIKRKLAENRLTTPLFDTRTFTQHIEKAFTMMYERHQAGLAPDHIVAIS